MMIKWKKIEAKELSLEYGIILDNQIEQKIFKQLEEEIAYFEGDLARVKIFGKWHDIPRKQASYGDSGLSYKYSGNIVPAQPWTPTLLELRNKIKEATGHNFNFVLVNRYKDGNDYMREHKDDEKDLDEKAPIASLSLGAARDFVFRHQDTKKHKGERKISNVKIILEPGSLLLMNYPTNQYWYHSLPKRKSCDNVRINLTFKKIKKIR